jgi:hypothetical protein
LGWGEMDSPRKDGTGGHNILRAMTVADSIGWIATAAFSTSYFAKNGKLLRRIRR